MRKYFFISAVALALLGTSCSQDDVTPAGQSNTTFRVSLPADMGTRFGEGTTAKNLFVAIYKSGTNTPIFSNFTTVDPDMTVSDFVIDPKTNRPTATVDVNLAKGETYDIICWAQSYSETTGEDAVYVYNPEDKTIKVNYGNYQNFAEDRDAFYGQKLSYTSSGVGANITLKRPFAQINVGTSDLAAYQRAGGSATQFGITVTGVSDLLDLTNGAVSESSANVLTTAYPIANAAPITKENAEADQTFPVTTANYDYLAMGYVLVGAPGTESANLKVQLTGTPALNEYAAWTEVPAMMNYRTNIYGTLLTNPEKFVIDLDAIFGDPDFNLAAIWDGTYPDVLPEPTKDPVTGNPVYAIESAADFAAVSAAVNDGELQKKAIIRLESDIDLNNKEWEPMGHESFTSGVPNHKFSGTFDGQGHTIRNLSIHHSVPGDYSHAFIGYGDNATVKNVVFENANISGTLHAAVVIGNPWNCTVDNVTVKGLVKIDGENYCAVIGGYNAFGTFSNITIDVDEGSYVKAICPGYINYVGSIIGHQVDATIKIMNVTSNIDVIASTYGAGGMAGLIQGGYPNVISNVTITGNVTIQNAEDPTDEYTLGGLIGAWVPSTKYDLTLDNVSFTGKLTTALNGVDYSDKIPALNQYIGYPRYNYDGLVKINGVTYNWKDVVYPE